jgi:hypothetical protein
MTLPEAKKFARKKILTATSLLLGICVLMLLLGETRGDFANGILFFFDAITSIHTVIILAIIYGLSYIFAASAGKEIIIEKQNPILIAVKYVILLSLAILVYALLIPFLKQNDFSRAAFNQEVTMLYLPLFFKTCFSLLFVWIWATRKMKTKANEPL